MLPGRSDGAAAPNAAPVQRQPVLPYGQACAGCAKAKCKCKRSAAAAAAPCQRCQRLGRACEPSQTTRKRGGGRPPGRTAQIEEKLETLVTILTSQAQPVANTNEAGKDATSLETNKAAATLEASVSETSLQLPILDFNDAVGTDTSPTSPGDTPSSSISDSIFAEIDQSQAEDNLRMFRTSHLPAFPAVHIPSTTTAAQLRLQRPYLWLAIQSLCCRPFSARAVLQKRVRRTFAERAVVQYECSVDLLMGHIVLAMWGTLTSCSKHAFYASAGVAATLAHNLKLDSRPGPDSSGFKTFAFGFHSNSAATKSVDGQRLVQRTRTNEERRAVLACFCLCSSTFHKLGTPPMRWTPHMEECLHHLAGQPECENDEILVIQTQCARILDDICSSSPSAFRSDDADGGVHQRLPSMLLTKALKGHLGEVRSHIRPPLLEKRVVKFWLLLTEVMIHDLELQNPGSVPTTSLSFARAESLQSCLSTINHFLDNLLSFKPQEHSGLHFHYWLNYLRCLRIVFSLLVTEDPAWDRNIIQESVDLIGSLQRGSEACRAIAAATGLDTNGKDAYTTFATSLQRIRSIWTEALEQAGVWPAGEGASVDLQPDTFQPAGLDDLYSFDVFDDAWMVDGFV